MELKLDDYNKVLEDYDFGKAISTTKLSGGFANLNFKVETEKGDILFRICLEKELEEIKYEIKVMNVLRENNFPTAFPIKKRDGGFINETDFGNVIIYEYVKGNEPKTNKETTKEIAKAVAKLNSINNWEELKKENSININLCEDLIKKFEKANNKYPKIFEFFKEETKRLKEPLKEKLPQGLVHGDIFPDNTRFEANKLRAIIDFEEVSTDNLLFDVGVTINGFCFRDSDLDQELFDLFIKEYETIRKLSLKEKELLPYYIRWGAHAMITWHLKHLLEERDENKIKRVNLFMERIKKLRN